MTDWNRHYRLSQRFVVLPVSFLLLTTKIQSDFSKVMLWFVVLSELVSWTRAEWSWITSWPWRLRISCMSILCFFLKWHYLTGFSINRERRLQTQVYKLGLAKSIHHARVLIRQRHIRVGKQIVNVPSFVVRLDSQKHIDFALTSPFGGGRPGRTKRKRSKAAEGGEGGEEEEEE